ncbi:AN1-type zinc finger domain-containing protein [Nitrosopumilus sp.]|nr:AN1-type zinc finger domain-containing protein [Nitrosopumilus sp.]
MISENCAYCGDMTEMPFHCSYCKDPFCAEHRLPEEHRCVKLRQIRSERFGEKKIIRDGSKNKGSIFKRIFRKS